MPLYQYRCVNGHTAAKTHGMSENPEILCSECQEPMRRVLSGGTGSFVKATTVGKYQKQERLRRKKSAELEIRQLERYGGKNKLVPNVDGQEVSSWKEAEQLAKDKGLKDSSKFKKYVEREDHSQNSVGVDERRLKALKEKAKNIH